MYSKALDDIIANHPEMFTGLYRVGELRSEKSEKTGITFQEEGVAVIRSEGMDLLRQHWAEVAQFPDIQQLDPDWDQYELFEKKGRLWALTARDQGVLIGYISVLLGNHLHYKTLKTAVEDVHFLHPDYRKGLTGYRLLALTRKAMALRGVQFWALRTKVQHDHGLLFERLGLEKHDMVYAGRL
jgi:hypothetical protein